MDADTCIASWVRTLTVAKPWTRTRGARHAVLVKDARHARGEPSALQLLTVALQLWKCLQFVCITVLEFRISNTPRDRDAASRRRSACAQDAADVLISALAA